MKINEMHSAIQGEGLTVGLPVYFVRLSGCNTQCDFCDTKYHKYGVKLDNKFIASQILDSKLEDIVFTGGEPMLQIKDVYDIIQTLPKHTFHLETNGSIYNKKADDFKFIACSPKKQQVEKGKLDSYKQFANLHQTIFKFVYENKESDLWIKKFMKDINIHEDRIWIMPEGKSRDLQIARMPEVMQYCLKNKFHFSPRLHILAYNEKRGV